MNDVLYEDEEDGINDSRDELCLRAIYEGDNDYGFYEETELQVKVIFETATALGKLY